MAQRSTNLVQDGFQRVRTAAETLDRGFQRLQKRFDSQRKTLEKQLGSRRKALTKRTQAQVEQIVALVRDNALIQRAESLREDATRQLETRVGTLLGALSIASKGDLEKIDRKLSQISRKLRDLEKHDATA